MDHVASINATNYSKPGTFKAFYIHSLIYLSQLPFGVNIIGSYVNDGEIILREDK